MQTTECERARNLNLILHWNLIITSSVLRAHFFQLSLIASFSHLFSSSSTIMFIDVIMFFIFTFAAPRYWFFIPLIFVISFIFAFKKIDFVMFHFRIHSEREIIEIMLIEVFDYQIIENKNLDMYRHEDLSFQLLIKRLTKKKLLMQPNLQKIMYDINNDRFVFDNNENFQMLFRSQHSADLSHVNSYVMTNFDFSWWSLFFWSYVLIRSQRLTTEILIKFFFRWLKKISKKLLNLYREAKMTQILTRMNRLEKQNQIRCENLKSMMPEIRRHLAKLKIL